MRRWTFRFNQSAAVVISLVEPITTVFIYPLVLDVYLASSLAKTCGVAYTVFVHLFLFCVTSASLCVMKYAMENICQLHATFEGKKPSLLFAFIFCSIWNILFTIYLTAIHQDWALIESYVPQNVTAPVEIGTVFFPGMKIFIPQVSLLVSILFVATAMSVCRPTWKASDKATVRTIWMYIAVSAIFQTIYLVTRMAFWYCSSTAYSRLSITIDFTEWVCYTKSLVFVVTVISVYYIQYFVKTELARRGVISIMDYRPLFNADH